MDSVIYVQNHHDRYMFLRGDNSIYACIEASTLLDRSIAVGNFIAHAAQVVAEFYMKLWNTVVNAVRAAVEEVKKVVDSLKDALINIVKDKINKIVGPIQDAINLAGDKLNEFAMKIVDIFKGKTVRIDILSWFSGSELYKVALIIPGILLTIYGIITTASMGMGAILMNYIPSLIISVVSNSILPMQSGVVSYPIGSDLLQGFENTIKSLLGNIDVYKALKFGSALLGFVLSMLCILQTYYVLNGKMFELNNAENDLNNMLNKVADTVNVFEHPNEFMDKAVPKVKQLTAVQTKMKEVRKGLTGSGWWMSILGVSFSAISIVILLAEWNYGKQLDKYERAILYGLSMGVGIGGIVTSLYSLVKSRGIPGIGWLSGLSIILGTAGVLDSIYEPQG